MKVRIILGSLVVLISAALPVFAQKTEISISLNEQFFDALLDAIYQNSPPPQFDLSSTAKPAQNASMTNAFAEQRSACGTITLLRENKATRTAVHFRGGKIYAPVAFTGSYDPPLVGCLEFSGYADTNIDLEFDRDSQKLVGRIHVLNVNINGTAGIGGTLVARMIQSSIDKKLNPIEIISLDKLSFPFTLPNSTRLRLHATGIRSEIAAGALNVVVSYEFVKD
ncbi:MAG TPA: hypothetical protein VGJ02_04040 [Pyrinomonadaceae bacterium]|jgi:hypothetical protein